MGTAVHQETTPEVTVTMKLVTDDATRDRALETFRSLVGQVRGQPGCLDCELLENVQDPGNLTVVHRWTSERALCRYACSMGFRRLLAGLDLSSERPEVTVHTEAESRGLEFFEGLSRSGPRDA